MYFSKSRKNSHSSETLQCSNNASETLKWNQQRLKWTFWVSGFSGVSLAAYAPAAKHIQDVPSNIRFRCSSFLRLSLLSCLTPARKIARSIIKHFMTSAGIIAVIGRCFTDSDKLMLMIAVRIADNWMLLCFPFIPSKLSESWPQNCPERLPRTKILSSSMTYRLPMSVVDVQKRKLRM